MALAQVIAPDSKLSASLLPCVADSATLTPMGFFGDVSVSSSRIPAGSPWDPPVAEFPCVAVSALLLARTEEVAVAVTAIWAFSAGFEFWIKAEYRESGPALESVPDDQSLHVGVLFADGKKAANVGRVPDAAGSVANGLILRPISFGGGSRHRDRSYWVWPLPPAGPLTFVCEWSALGIPETRAEVDAQMISNAARHSLKLWPEETS